MGAASLVAAAVVAAAVVAVSVVAATRVAVPHNTKASVEQAPVLSFIEFLHQAPRLVELLPPEALKNLTATCRSLRTSYCEKVKVIHLSCSADATKLCCKTWPQLVMVTCNRSPNLESNLSAQWECMLEVSVVKPRPRAYTMNAVLIRPVQPHTSEYDLSYQYCAVLSAFADRHRHTAASLTIRGAILGCKVVQSLTHNDWPLLHHMNVLNSSHLAGDSMSYLLKSLPALTAIAINNCRLDAAALLDLSTGWPQLTSLTLTKSGFDTPAAAAIRQARWHHLYFMCLDFSLIGAAGMQHLVSCSWPSLQTLSLKHTGIGAPALLYLAHGQWPHLSALHLQGNNIDATGVSYLIQGDWPSLSLLNLSAKGLGKELCLLLGIADSYGHNINSARLQRLDGTPQELETLLYSCRSSLPQVPRLLIGIFKD